MKIVPSNYRNILEELNITDFEQILIEKISSIFLDEPAMLLLKISPVSGVKADICLIHRDLGIFFIFTRQNLSATFEQAVATNSIVSDFYKEKVLERLETHRQLLSENGNVKTPVGFLFYFPEVLRKQITPTNFAQRHCLFKDDVEFLTNENLLSRLRDCFIYTNREFLGLDDSDLNAIHYTIVPEYRIPKFDLTKQYALLEENGLSVNEPLEILTDSRELVKFKALSLTEEQINLVNELEYGSELLLAGAGSGKTVLLAARAFRVAKLFEDKKILLTCYNKSLSEYMDVYLDTAGMKARNLTCKTFHAFCRYLLESNNIPLPRQEVHEEYFDALFEKAAVSLKDGKIHQRYFAIFIDEIQDFKKEWIRFLYNLLENKKKFIFNICGDKTQDVRRIISDQGIPWNSKDLPDFESSKKILTQNFRSSPAINQYIKLFNNQAKKKFELLNLEISKDRDYFLNSKSVKRGRSRIPEIITVSTYEQEIEDTIKAVKSLRNNHEIPYSDIAILFPFKKAYKYYPYYYLTIALERENIPYTSLLERGDTLEGYHNRSGVTVSTIHSSKGLDFRAVVLFGLAALRPTRISVTSRKEDKLQFQSNVQLLYTCLTRPEDYLKIVLHEKLIKSDYADLLIEPAKMLIQNNRLRRKKRESAKS